MQRQYHKWFSPHLGRDMEMLVFGHGGLPAVVFPTSQGRYYEFEDRGMVDAIRWKIDNGEVQLFCVDSVDSESWYNRNVPPRWKVARQVQYDEYVIQEVVPLMKQMNWSPKRATVGCSFGGYHAVTMALRHPDVFTAFLSMSGAFDMDSFLGGYHDQDVYFNQPTQFLHQMGDPWFLDRYRQNTYVLATGEHDQCWNQNEKLGGIMRAKGIPVRLDVWGHGAGHDWPWWQKMVQTYL